MILGGTGHRPDRIGGAANEAFVRREIRRHLLEQQPERVYLGMARGFDMWLAEECSERGILWVPMMARGQFALWPAKARGAVWALLSSKHCVREHAEIHDGNGMTVYRPEWSTEGPSLSEPTNAFWQTLYARWPYWKDALQARNEAIVNHVGKMLCCWDGRTGGGTWNAISYAMSRGKNGVAYKVSSEGRYVSNLSFESGTLIRIDPREAP